MGNSVVKDPSVSRTRQFYLLLLLLFAPVSTLADTATPAVFSAAAILRLIGALFFVLLVFFFLIWVFRRLQPGAVAGAGGTMRVIASLPLGARERLLLVEVGKQQLLLGATPAGITLLHTLSEPLPLDSSSLAFTGWLRQAMERRKNGSWQNFRQESEPARDSSCSPGSSAGDSSS